MKLSDQESRTAELFGEIHAIVEHEHTSSASDKVLTPDHLEVSGDFLKGRRALDAGVGGMGRALRSIYKLGCRDITAIDISKENIRNAMRANRDISQFINYETKNVLSLDYEDSAFDFIHCSGVLVCVESPERGLRQFYRCLSPGGWLYVALYGSGGVLYGLANLARRLARFVPYEIAFRSFVRLFRGAVASYFLDYLYAPIQFHYSEEEARELVSRSGFSDVRRLKQPRPLSSTIWDKLIKPSTFDPRTRLGSWLAGSGWIILMAQKPDAEHRSSSESRSS